MTSGGDGTDELIVSYLNPEGDSETVEGGDGIYILSMPAYSLTVTISRWFLKFTAQTQTNISGCS